MAWRDADAQAADAGAGRAGEQNGADRLGAEGEGDGGALVEEGPVGGRVAILSITTLIRHRHHRHARVAA